MADDSDPEVLEDHRPTIAASELPEFWRSIGRVENPIRAGFWRIAALSGLRKNYIATMRWEHVHEGRIHIPHPKMKKPFDVPPTGPLRDVLQDLREHGRVMYPHSPYVCAASSRLGYLQNPYDKALVGYSPHQCRRAYAGAAAHVLKNPYLVKALLAHAISDVTEMYVVVDFEQKAEAAAVVANWLMMKLTGSSPAPVRLLQWQGDSALESSSA